jgi:hypothetical protein
MLDAESHIGHADRVQSPQRVGLRGNVPESPRQGDGVLAAEFADQRFLVLEMEVNGRREYSMASAMRRMVTAS